jgi:hypothetical protein
MRMSVGTRCQADTQRQVASTSLQTYLLPLRSESLSEWPLTTARPWNIKHTPLPLLCFMMVFPGPL